MSQKPDNSDTEDSTGTIPCSRYRSLVNGALTALMAAAEIDKEYQGDMCAECFREGLITAAIGVVTQLRDAAENGR